MSTKCPKCHTDNPEDSKFCKECATPLPGIQDAIHTKTMETSVEELTTGSTFAGRYQIIEELGKGGMGRVYKVLDRETKEKIALKLIKPEIASDKTTIERFRNELTSARKIAHRNVCRMYDLNKEEDDYYITMEFVSGGDLKRLIRRTKHLPVGTAISIAKQICEGLEEAHRLGIVHRDLKPNNIMIDDNGNARIMDFGIARTVNGKSITSSGVMIGTPEYMSPEQVEVKEVDQRSDIYSLGVILYEMVTGQLPFEGETPLAVAMKHKGEPPKNPKEFNPQISDDLNRVILTCLEKDKDSRYQSAGEVRSELKKIEQGLPTSDRSIPGKKTLTSQEITVQFSLKKISIPVFIALAIVVIGLIILNPWGQKEQAPDRTEKPSLAVLPFEDLSPQKDQGYFCDGMTDEIIADLYLVGDIGRVISRSSVMKFKGTKADSKTIGQELGVRYLLEGSLRKSANEIRITARLIDTLNDAQLWAGKYTEALEDIFEIQENISQSIINELSLELKPDEMQKITQHSIKDVRAYEYYLRAMQEINILSEESLDRAIKFLQNGLDILGENTMMYIGLGEVYSTYLDYGFKNGEVYLQQAEDYGKKALALEPDNALALNLVGNIELMKGNMPESLTYKKLSFLKDPNVPENLTSLLYYYGFFAGKPSVAALLVQRLLQIDPLSPSNPRCEGIVAWMEGKFDIALELHGKASQMVSNAPVTKWYYAQLLAWNNRFDEAYEYIDNFVKDLPQHILSWSILLFKYSLQGEKDKALQLLTEERKNYALKDYHFPWLMAECFALLDEKEDALDWFELAIGKGWINYPLFSELDPFLENIRGEARFKKLIEKVKYEWQHIEDLEWPKEL